MVAKSIARIFGLCCLVSLSGCGNEALFVVPDDCAFFSREEARDWFANAQARRSDGASELEAFGAVLAECLASNCDGDSGGVCAVSCASCTDALVTIAYP